MHAVNRETPKITQPFKYSFFFWSPIIHAVLITIANSIFYDLQVTSELQITSVRPEDQGRYRCLAHNSPMRNATLSSYAELRVVCTL